MKSRLGIGVGLTALVGAVAAAGGLSSSLSGQIGYVTCSSGGSLEGCTAGTLTATVHNVGTGTLPSGWALTVTSSNCSVPSASATGTVAAGGGSASFGPLYPYASDHTTPCVYSVTEAPATGWTTTYSPTTVSLTASGNAFAGSLAVTNTAKPKPTPTPTPTPTPKPPAHHVTFPVQSATGV